MTTKEFIKQYGWDEAKSTVDSFKGISHKLDENENVIFTFQIDDLKQYVDAWELTSCVGSMVECKRLLSMLEKSNIPHMTFGGEFNGRSVEQKVLTIDFKKPSNLWRVLMKVKIKSFIAEPKEMRLWNAQIVMLF